VPDCVIYFFSLNSIIDSNSIITGEKKLHRTFMSAPSVELGGLNNLFFELCRKSCNLKCKHCYIERNPYKQEKDFIAADKIKNALIQSKGENVKSIYLTGGEPLLHPDFNAILRMCLKFANTTVLTNGTFVNDKKARFLRKIDDESNFETIYRISIDHYDELKNDALRTRGAFRKAFQAVGALYKYGFNPIISVTNYYNESRASLFEGFNAVFSKINFELEEINLKISPYFKPDIEGQIEMGKIDVKKLDCYNSRIVSSKGVFSCPVLCNDFRARQGSEIDNYSKKVYLDTEKCFICAQHPTKAFANDWL